MQKMTLRALRTNYSLSAKEVAEEIGIHHQTLLKYEHDSTRIPVNLLRKRLCKVKINQFFNFM